MQEKRVIITNFFLAKTVYDALKDHPEYLKLHNAQLSAIASKERDDFMVRLEKAYPGIKG